MVVVTYLDYTDTWKTGFVQIPGQPVSGFLEKWRPSQLFVLRSSLQSKQNKYLNVDIKHFLLGKLLDGYDMKEKWLLKSVSG